jgi:alkanesulfonate monooxygenase
LTVNRRKSAQNESKVIWHTSCFTNTIAITIEFNSLNIFKNPHMSCVNYRAGVLFMSRKIFWQLPVQGDGRSVQASARHRGEYSSVQEKQWVFSRTGHARDGFNYFDYLAQVVGAADLGRFDGVWVPQSDSGEEPLIVAGAFVREARHVHFVTALRAPLLSAVYAAKIANSFQRLSGGRLAWYLHHEADREHTWHGRHWSLEEQIARTSEFLGVAKGFWTVEPFTYEGKYFLVQDGVFPPALQGQPFPVIYLSGTTPAAFDLSARHGDVHVFDLAPLAEIESQIRELRKLAEEQKRTLTFALRAHVVAREDREEAWEALRISWDHGGGTEAEFESLRRDEGIWAGFEDYGNAPVAGFIGGYQDIINDVNDYAELGISEFIFAASPAVEEAYRFSEKLLPFLRDKQYALKKAS